MTSKTKIFILNQTESLKKGLEFQIEECQKLSIDHNTIMGKYLIESTLWIKEFEETLPQPIEQLDLDEILETISTITLDLKDLDLAKELELTHYYKLITTLKENQLELYNKGLSFLNDIKNFNIVPKDNNLSNYEQFLLTLKTNYLWLKFTAKEINRQIELNDLK